MSDLVKGFSGLWKFVAAWILPCAIGVFSCALVVVEPVRAQLPRDGFMARAGDLVGGSAGALVWVTLTLAVVLALSQKGLYRLLEGYLFHLLPGPLHRWALGREQRRWDSLRLEYQRHLANGTADSDAAERVREALQQMPKLRAYVMPTRLGSAIKALETFGKVEYGIDTVTLWYELYGCAPESVKQAIDDARGVVDFNLCFVYVCGIFALCAGVAAAVYGSQECVVALLVVSILMPAFYRRAVSSVATWRLSVQAMVNLSRTQLALALGLTLPETLREEREMWSAVGDFVYWGTPKYAVELERFRHRAVAADDRATGARCDSDHDGGWHTSPG